MALDCVFSLAKAMHREMFDNLLLLKALSYNLSRQSRLSLPALSLN
jgi:hypothetical protein